MDQIEGWRRTVPACPLRFQSHPDVVAPRTLGQALGQVVGDEASCPGDADPQLLRWPVGPGANFASFADYRTRAALRQPWLCCNSGEKVPISS
jgi:hypothetical protein